MIESDATHQYYVLPDYIDDILQLWVQGGGLSCHAWQSDAAHRPINFLLCPHWPPNIHSALSLLVLMTMKESEKIASRQDIHATNAANGRIRHLVFHF